MDLFPLLLAGYRVKGVKIDIAAGRGVMKHGKSVPQ